MRHYKVSLSNSNWKNNLLEDYLKGADFLKSFYHYEPQFDNLFKAIEDRKKFPVQRNLLVDVLLDQNKDFLNANGLAEIIQQLKSENTFTITTGHQLGIAGGPLLFIYKIITTIKLAKQLNEHFANENFVPVFWMASEDHDFAEIASIRVFNNQLTWNNTDAAVACGELATQSLNDLIEELKKINGESSNAIELNKILSDCYQSGLTLAEATRKFVYALLGEYGIVVIDANDARLKKVFAEIMHDELFNHTAHQKVVATSDRIAEKYHPQVFPREINLFYKHDKLRARFEDKGDERFSIANTEMQFTYKEVKEMLNNHPEMFSPNVIMRPLYQEKILPNIAYVGGAGELAYWLQLKSLFEHHQVFYPMLINRNNALIISEKLLTKASSVGINEDELCQDEQSLIKLVVERTITEDFSVKKNMEIVLREFDSMVDKATTINVSMEKYILSERQKTMNAVENIEKKMLQSIKKKNEISLNVCKQISNEVFPSNHPQEREQSLIPFYLKEGKSGIEYLFNHMKPFDNKILVVVSE